MPASVSPASHSRVARTILGLAIAVACGPGLFAAENGSPSARAAFERGAQLRATGNPIGARPFLQEAAAAAEQAGDRRLLQQVLDELAEVQGALSDWAGMLDFAQRSYDVMPDPTGRTRVRFLKQRGRVLQELHESDAIAAYLEAVPLAQALRDDVLLGELYNELGLATWRLERDWAKALKYYDDSIALLKRQGDSRALMQVYNNSANLFRRPTMYPEAERRYREGMAVAKGAGIEEDASLLKNMGIVLRETGRRREAEQSLLRAVHVADTKGNGRILWQGRMELGTLYSATDVNRAAHYFEETLTALEGLNNNVLLEGFRAGALSGAVTINDDPYDLYTNLLMNNGRERDAFYIAERARARAFLDTLSLAREEIAGALPAEFVSEERSILERISANQAALRAAKIDAGRRALLGREIRDDEERLTRIRVRLATDYPALANARYPRILKVDDVQTGLLRQDEVLLQYFVGARAGSLWIITPTGFHVRRLPARKEIEAAVRNFLETLSRPDGDFTPGAKRLGAMLLPGLDAVLSPASRLIVVPHAILNYVPFEALLDGSNRFVVERYAMSYAPSTSSLAFLRSRRSSGTQVVAVGNPVMRVAGAAIERGQPLDRLDTVRSLKPLQHTGAEARAVSGVYGSAARLFEQEKATEAVLSGADAARAGIIHIATHGLIDEGLPERSGLALTAAPPASDGLLQMREIYNLRLNAALVTLSACQTAIGKEVTGEGLIGLSRAFFYAGANAVLASLWNVNDASTEQLMAPFYRSLASGEPIDRALRTAKVGLLDGRFGHPYYWAAFIVSGNGTAAVAIRPRGVPYGWLGAGAILILGTGVLAWRRVR